MTILRKLTVVFLALTLSFTTIACGGGTPEARNTPQANTARQVSSTPSKLNDGKYPVQQASYDDANGEYTLFLLNATPPTYKTENVQMARLTEEQIKAGEKSYLQVTNGQPALYLTEDFKIEYVHNVTETRNNPQTGQQETVVVQRQNGFWAPFAGALAGQAIGSLLFRPQYYVPPAYQPGNVMVGYGGYGSNYNEAVNRYRERYQAPPAAVRNRSAFRTTGSVRNSYPGRNSNVRTAPTTNTGGSRATGSGYGSSTLRQSGRSNSPKRTPSFGSGRSSAPRRSTGFGSGRRR
jgi:hypothetical protein